MMFARSILVAVCVAVVRGSEHGKNLRRTNDSSKGRQNDRSILEAQKELSPTDELQPVDKAPVDKVVQKSCNPNAVCITRGPQGNSWVTGNNAAFLSSLNDHFSADWLLDGKMICSYKIQWFSGSWSERYYPGRNDNVWTGKNDGAWNDESHRAGRRQWSLFSDHNHEVCYCPESPCGETCESRGSDGEEWVTARGATFAVNGVTKTHMAADWLLDGRKICSYKIKWFSGQWSGKYFPGKNDNVNTGKSDNVWSAQSFGAGRRQWTLFADHDHEVCYCNDYY